jgi:hypothetical protein
LEKRLAAKLVESAPAILVDNVNGVALKSAMLASVITESPAEIRILGKTQMTKLNSTALFFVTGNGLQISEDLARRFIEVRFDAGTEDPEARPFDGDIVTEVLERRADLLAAALTIWRWGRVDASLARGKPLGGFEKWSQWVGDPLRALGCQDPVERISEAKASDPRRQRTSEIFHILWERHGDHPVFIKELHEDVRAVIDPQGRGRQFLTSAIRNMEGTRAAGFMLTCQRTGRQVGNCDLLAAQASLNIPTVAKSIGTIGGIGPKASRSITPMPPMPPMLTTTPAEKDGLPKLSLKILSRLPMA